MIGSYEPINRKFTRAQSGANDASRENSATAPADKKFIKMPKTANGNPRFPSRSDGAEAGVVSNGYEVGPKVI